MIALCRKAGAIASERFWKRGGRGCALVKRQAFLLAMQTKGNIEPSKSRRIRNRRAPHFCTERINDLPIAKPERKRFALVLKGRELTHHGIERYGTPMEVQCGPRISAF